MDIVETLLPGVGIRYEMRTAEGTPLGIVMHRGGGAEIVTYRKGDPDAVEPVVTLTREETTALADLLGAPRLTERFADLSREVPGLESARLQLGDDSAYAERPLGDTKARTRTGCSIVALVRGSEVVTAPGPDDLLRSGDILVAIGSASGLDALNGLLRGG